MFQRPSVRYGRTPEPETPYQKAAQVWDERIGSARVQARNWRLMAFGCADPVGGLGARPRLAISRAARSRPGWCRSIVSARRRRSRPRHQTISRPIRRSPITSRASSRMCGDCRPIRHRAAPGLAARLRLHHRSRRRRAQRLSPAPTIPSPISARCRSRSRSPASSAPRQTSFRVAWIQRAYENGRLPQPSAGPRSSPS